MTVIHSTRHRDYRGRESEIDPEYQDREHCINPTDGRLRRLSVQVKDEDLLDDTDGINWKRKKLDVPGSWLDRTLYWTWSSVSRGHPGGAQRSSTLARLEVALKWIPSCILLFILFFIPQKVGGVLQNSGYYEPIREDDRYYAKVARNPSEDNPDANLPLLDNLSDSSDFDQPPPLEANTATVEDEFDEDFQLGLMYRPLRPRKLCFLVDNNDPSHPRDSYEVRDGQGNDPYVFVSYTRVAFEPDSADVEILLRFAVEAAKQAGVPAFWIDIMGVKQMPQDAISEDVYRICDVLRGADSMVVINGGPSDQQYEDYDEDNHEMWLRSWGWRMWVLTELLLAPPNREVSVFTRRPFTAPEDIVPVRYTKRVLAQISCRDAIDVRQLIEHYDGNILLTPLELVQIALRCLNRRETKTRASADLAYALKGLLRRRPRTIKKESDFEAFASLSLVNDSQRLLERLICTLPLDPEARWTDMRDAWHIQLWDIEPSCQVAGIVDDRTVLLDGAHAASIRWNKLERVAFVTKNTPFRMFAKFFVRGIPAWTIISLLLVVSSSQLIEPPEDDGRYSLENLKACPDGDAKCLTKQFLGISGRQFHRWFGKYDNPFLVLAFAWCFLTLAVIISSPYLLYRVYHGKFWRTQALFFGIEGNVEDLADIERRLFGINKHRLTWSTNGSTLSQHHQDPDTRERVADPPTRDSKLHKDVTSEPRQRLFTLVDTYTMTVTQFFAFHPPTAVFICGQEGGMQRAVLCSYDWKQRTWCRESVLRMKTLVLEKMSRVDRFQFALKRCSEKAEDNPK